MNDSLIEDVLFRYAFIVSMLVGISARFIVLSVKDKQYPSRPQDYIEQIIIAALASALGSIAFPALIDKEFSALTFLAVGIQQFQGSSKQEKITLQNIDGDDLLKKGDACIDEISTIYEVRSYVSLFSALVSSILFIYIARKFDASMIVCSVCAVTGGILVAIIFKKLIKRGTIEEIADIHMAKISFDGPILKVNDIYMDNIGLKDSRKKYLEKGMAIEIVPKTMGDFGTINDIGQREAILHNIYIHFGIDKDVDEVDLLSISRTDLNKKTVVMVMIPLVKDEVNFIKVAGGTSILDTAKGKNSAYRKKEFNFKL